MVASMHHVRLLSTHFTFVELTSSTSMTVHDPCHCYERRRTAVNTARHDSNPLSIGMPDRIPNTTELFKHAQDVAEIVQK